jgi:molybdopterin-containing oxidoreductase family iron-sulfur binding subunit
VEACPVGARKFGDLNDPDSVISKLLESRQVFRLKEELGANPRFFYLG